MLTVLSVSMKRCTLSKSVHHCICTYRGSSSEIAISRRSCCISDAIDRQMMAKSLTKSIFTVYLSSFSSFHIFITTTHGFCAGDMVTVLLEMHATKYCLVQVRARAEIALCVAFRILNETTSISRTDMLPCHTICSSNGLMMGGRELEGISVSLTSHVLMDNHSINAQFEP